MIMLKSKIPFTALLVCLFLTNIASSQPFFLQNDSIPVKINGNTILNPWAGGLNFIQISEIDLNLDGIKDLFIFDRTGNKIRTYINAGTANAVDYKYDPKYESKFPKLHDWALLRDYNCDGKEDIFSYSDYGGGFNVYKNTSSIATGLQFTLVKQLTYSIYNPPAGGLINLYISSVDIPSIADIDNDGDLDVVTFAITGTFMEYHQNQSMELYGTCDSLKFQMKNRCWGYAAESPLNNKFTLHDTCFGNVANPGIIEINSDQRSADRHSGSCEICMDLNGDGAKDIVVGGISYNNLTSVMNGGSPTSANMISVDTLFPANNSSTSAVNLTQFPCAYYLDVNNDGKKDLIVSPNSNGSENFNSVIFYKNTGTTNFPVFQFQQSNFLQDNIIDVGEGAYPVFFDYDNDGLKDLFIGNYGYYGSPNYQSKIAQFKNTGTASNPKFDLVTRDYNNLSTLGKLNLAPAFGDMDGDGDGDMIIGMFDGKLFYYENTALSGAPASFVTTPITLKNSSNRAIDVGDFAAPQIIDVDNDGKNDIVIGGRSGKLAFYHHTGSATATNPVLDSVSHFWGNVKVIQYGYVTGYSYPCLFKQAGVTKLLVGAENGYLRLFDNIDGNISGAFTLVDSTYLNIYEGAHTSPTATDINNDGYLDFMIGNYQGGAAFYKGVSSLSETIENNDNTIHWNLEVFPNPADNSVTIHILNNTNSRFQVEIYNVMGQIISSQKIFNSSLGISTENLSQGIYVFKVVELATDGKVKSGALTKRIVIQH